MAGSRVGILNVYAPTNLHQRDAFWQMIDLAKDGLLDC